MFIVFTVATYLMTDEPPYRVYCIQYAVQCTLIYTYTCIYSYTCTMHIVHCTV